MVGREDLMNAIALNSSMVNGARVVGPAVAGLLVAAVGEGWCFLLNGISYIAVIAGLLMMDVARTQREPRPAFALSRHGRRLPVRRADGAGAGAAAAARHREPRRHAVRGADAGVRRIDSARRRRADSGMLMAASGLGALGGALSLAARRGVRGLGRGSRSGGARSASRSVLFSLSRSFWLSVALLVPVGFSLMVQMAASNTLIQAMVPDALRGRVMSVYSMMFLGMAPFGGLSAGYAAERIGAPATVAVGGVDLRRRRRRLPAAAAVAARSRRAQLIVAQGLAAGEPPPGITARGIAGVVNQELLGITVVRAFRIPNSQFPISATPS